MGGAGGYARPVEPTNGRISTWRAHTNRGIPSSEPGVDYFCPIGTPIRAAASGVVVDVGTSIMPATGRYITVDLDDGRRVRYLHILRHKVGVGTRVRWGQHIADSGATGYGEADWSWNVAGTGGAHVHMTLWAHQRYVFGRYSTLDPERYMASDQGDKPKPQSLPPLPKGKTMADVKQIHWMNGDKVGGRALIVPGTAWAVPFTESGSTYANRSAKQFDTGDSEEYTRSLFAAFLRAGERCAPTSVTVEIVDADA